MKVTWRPSQHNSTTTEAFLGPYRVGAVFWSYTQRVGSQTPWETSFDLPAREGKAWKTALFADQDDARLHIELLVGTWISNATAQQEEG